MVKSPPNIQKNTFNILRNTGIFPDIFRMFCIFQYYPEKHDCIFRNIRLYISVWDSIFQNIRIFRNILPEISEYSGIYCQYFSGYFLKIQYYTAVYSGIFRLKMARKRSELSSDIPIKKIPEYSQIFSDIPEYFGISGFYVFFPKIIVV